VIRGSGWAAAPVALPARHGTGEDRHRMETTNPALTESHHSTVTEDQIDHLGHMNVRFYGVNANAATRAVLAELGVEDPAAVRLVDIYTRHHREQLLGARLVVRSGVVDVTDNELVLYHELANEDADILAATFVHRMRVGVVSEAVRTAARARLVTIPSHGATRSISLAADPIAGAPSLAELRARELAIRKVRAVSADECAPDGSYLSTMTPALVWAGEPVDRRFPEMLHEGPNGERMGWASMETRITINRLPRLGDRVQSFSAVIGLGDKVLHNIMWAWDVDREELLITFEIVNLAFDIGARRPMQIPESIRSAERMMLHADLAPTAD
jgi:acyl-CoA thioester hydrolase